MTAKRQVILDTNVWVALFRRRLHPTVLRRVAGDHGVLIPPIVMAELASLVERRELSIAARRFVERRGYPLALDGNEAWEAGTRYGAWGPDRGGGIADALILQAARSRGALLVTFDPDFADEPGVHVLDPESM